MGKRTNSGRNKHVDLGYIKPREWPAASAGNPINSLPGDRFQRSNGKRYRITGSRSTGFGPFDVIDTLKSIETGKSKEWGRKDLISFLRS